MARSGSTRLLTQQERHARTHEQDVYPLVGQKLADLLTRGLSLPPQAHALQMGCGLGTTTTELLHRLDADSRLIAIEASQAFVERARANVPPEYLGRRVFFRAHDLVSRLPFADNAFNPVLANVALSEHPSPAAFIAEAARVTKPGGTLRLATLVAGTWREFLDVYSDVLLRLRKNDAATALLDYARAFPEPEALAKHLEASGFAKVDVDTTHWEIVFRTSREFFYAPVIEQGPLGRWKAIAGKGPEMQDIFIAVKQAIDTYFGGSAFSVSLVGGLFSAVKGE
jgi:ubiquinone/menaquinone biosynthesis C-methylase UbiE